MVNKKCVVCSKRFSVHNYRKETAKCCSSSCLGVYIGQQRRKNAKPILWGKYFFIKIPGHHRANKQGYVKYADIVLEKKLGRRLKNKELAHHIDENKKNDNLGNLELMTNHNHCVHTSGKFWGAIKLFKWSCKYEKCVDCGTQKKRHWAKGRCKNCYRKFNELNKTICT